MKKTMGLLSFVLMTFLLKISCISTTGELAHSDLTNLILFDQDNKPISLSKLVEEHKSEGVVLFFYPKDGTSICTKQLQLINDSLLQFAQKKYLVFGINKDSPESHKKFSQKYKFNSSLLSDKEGKVHKALNIKNFFGMPSRTTIILDKNLKLAHPPFVNHISAKKHIEYALSKI